MDNDTATRNAKSKHDFSSYFQALPTKSKFEFNINFQY